MAKYVVVPFVDGEVRWMLASPICDDLNLARSMADLAKEGAPEWNFVVLSFVPKYSTHSPSELSRDIKSVYPDADSLSEKDRAELEHAFATLAEMDKQAKKGMN